MGDTKDKNIRRRAGEREAVVTGSARIITLTSGNMRGEAMAKMFVDNVDVVARFAASQPAPFVATLGPGGLRLLHTAQTLSGPQSQTDQVDGHKSPPDTPSES